MFSSHSYEFIEALLCERHKTGILIMIYDIRYGQCFKSDINTVEVQGEVLRERKFGDDLERKHHMQLVLKNMWERSF